MKHRPVALFVVLLAVTAALPVAGGSASTSTRYMVLLAGQQTDNGFNSTGSVASARTLVQSNGGTIAADLSRQIGVLIADSLNPAFATSVGSSSLISEAAQDFSWKAFPSYQEAIASGQLVLCGAASCPPPGGGPDPSADVLEALQWDMEQIEAPQAHDIQAGSPSVDIGVLDSGIDSNHVDFKKNGVSNVDTARGQNFTLVGTPGVLTDNQFHGTHVAGTIAARVNGVGVVGVAPNVTLVPVKVCDSAGYCYATPVVRGITYAGDIKLDAINMSFFVDDDELLGSTEFKCSNDPVQRAFRHAVERAIQYARGQGVTPVAALGNSDEDLAHPAAGNDCEVVPAETQGVIGTMALGSEKEKAGYSNYGSGMTDVAAPGGNGTTGDCTTTVLSTLPNDLYGCIQGTSMASPHTTGVVALIISQFGTLGADGDVNMSPTKVESYLQSTVVDQGLKGYDECFGNGRINALRAIRHDTSNVYDGSAPFCPEYNE
jgi:lantibiotic leader peptide-processing serine protease